MSSYGNPAAVLDTFAGMRGYRVAGEDTAGTTEYVATASEGDQVMRVMGLDQLEAVGGSQVAELLSQYLAETSEIEETVWVDDDGRLSQAKLVLTNSAGERPECEFLPGELSFAISEVKVDESVTIAVPAEGELAEAPTTSAATPDAGQLDTMAAALQACFT